MNSGEPSLTDEQRVLLDRILAGKQSVAPAAIPTGAPAEPLPLSEGQRNIWAIEALAPGTTLNHLGCIVSIRRSLDLEIFRASVNQVVSLHDALRTTIDAEAGEPHQRIAAALQVNVPLTDCRHRRTPDVHTMMQTELRRPFAFATEPLFRLALYRIEDEVYELLFVLHHVIGDGGSMGLFLKDLMESYAALASHNGAMTRSPASVRYADYLHWRTHDPERDRREQEALRFWKRALVSDLEPATLAADRRNASLIVDRSERVVRTIKADVHGQVERTRRRLGISFASCVLAAAAVALHRFSGASRPVIGVYVSRRQHPATLSMVGMFVHTIPAPMQCGDNPSFRVLAEAAHQLLGQAGAQEEISIGRLARALCLPRSDGANPLFRVAISFQRRPPPLASHALHFRNFHYEPSGVAIHDMLVNVFDDDSGVGLAIDYRATRYERETIECFAAALEAILANAACNPDMPIAELPLTAVEHTQPLWARWLGRRSVISSSSILHRIEMTLAERAERVAVSTVSGSSMTYAELDQRSDRLRAALEARGLQRNDRVAILVAKGSDWPVAVLAVMKAGGCFIPIDIRHPRKYVELIVDDAKPRFVLVDGTRASLCAGLPVECVAVDAHSAVTPSGRRADRRVPELAPTDAAYIIYTSGTTGRPKGVRISHGSLVNVIESLAQRPGFRNSDTILSTASPGFDISIVDLLLPLAIGGHLAILPSDIVHDGEAIVRALSAFDVTVMQATPSIWQLLLAAGWTGKSNLTIWSGGEALPPALATQLLTRCRELWNVYGPTEATVWSTVQRIDAGNEHIGLGTPVDNTEIFVLEPGNLQPALPGMQGELWIGGAGVALGYLNRPELDVEKFQSLDIPGRGRVRTYRTGDLVQVLPGGVLEFVGRRDQQVKLRGYRVELGEIDVAACEHPEIVEAAAVVREINASDKRLILYYRSRHAVPVNDLRRHLEERLPAAMVPSSYVRVESMPRTYADKLDTRALPAIGTDNVVEGAQAAANEAERRVLRHWCTTLQRSDIDVERQFFEQGGDSLLMMALKARLEQEFAAVIAVADLYRFPTIRSFARHLAVDKSAHTDDHAARAARRATAKQTLRRNRQRE